MDLGFATLNSYLSIPEKLLTSKQTICLIYNMSTITSVLLKSILSPQIFILKDNIFKNLYITSIMFNNTVDK